METYYPPVSFFFRVEWIGLSSKEHDIRFTEVSGLSVELTSEEMAEGGENRFVQKYPSRAKYPELILKRGLLTDSGIVTWVQKCIDDLQIEPKDIDVTLLNEERQPLLVWHVHKAYPTKWAVSDLNSTSNTVVVETLQFYYQYYTVDRN